MSGTKKPRGVTGAPKRATVASTPVEPAGPPASLSPGRPRPPSSAADRGLAMLDAAAAAADDERAHMIAHEREMRELEAIAAVIRNAIAAAVRVVARNPGPRGMNADTVENAFAAAALPCSGRDARIALSQLVQTGELESVSPGRYVLASRSAKCGADGGNPRRRSQGEAPLPNPGEASPPFNVSTVAEVNALYGAGFLPPGALAPGRPLVVVEQLGPVRSAPLQICRTDAEFVAAVRAIADPDASNCRCPSCPDGGQLMASYGGTPPGPHVACTVCGTVLVKLERGPVGE
jgi:hypothetical protein